MTTRLQAIRKGEIFHTVLPVECQRELKRAAEAPKNEGKTLARAQEIERAILWCKCNHPQYFK